MAGRILNWQRSNANARKQQSITNTRYRSMPADAAFWRAWKDNPAAMREAGYAPVKTAAGWEVRIEIK